MKEAKYIVTLKVPDEVIERLKVARLSLDDLVVTKIQQALLNFKGDTKVYNAESGVPATELYDLCPVCTHPWAKHFDFTDPSGKKLIDPLPGKCPEPECTCLAKDVL